MDIDSRYCRYHLRLLRYDINHISHQSLSAHEFKK